MSDVQHDETQHRFYVDLDPYEAFLVYAREGQRLDFYHIYVPDPYRGSGLAGRILIAAFEYARANGLRVIATCPFIRGDFLSRFSQYQELVDEGEFMFRKPATDGRG